MVERRVKEGIIKIAIPLAFIRFSQGKFKYLIEMNMYVTRER